jgi:hypothetical protein
MKSSPGAKKAPGELLSEAQSRRYYQIGDFM